MNFRRIAGSLIISEFSLTSITATWGPVMFSGIRISAHFRCSSDLSWSSPSSICSSPGAIAKGLSFAPIFVPLLMKLGVAPEALLAGYRVGDSPINSITPLNAYFALVVGLAQKYDKNAGAGTIVALMLP